MDTRQSQSYNFKQVFKNLNTQHTFWSWLIRCVNMKWIWLVLREIQSGHDSIHRRTDGWTDRQTDKVKPVYPPFNFIELRGIIKLKNIYIFGLLGEQPARASFLSPISGHVRTISANERRRLLFSHWLRSFSGALRQWIENGTWSHAWETREKHSSSWEWLPCCVWIKMHDWVVEYLPQVCSLWYPLLLSWCCSGAADGMSHQEHLSSSLLRDVDCYMATAW